MRTTVRKSRSADHWSTCSEICAAPDAEPLVTRPDSASAASPPASRASSVSGKTTSSDPWSFSLARSPSSQPILPARSTSLSQGNLRQLFVGSPDGHTLESRDSESLSATEGLLALRLALPLPPSAPPRSSSLHRSLSNHLEDPTPSPRRPLSRSSLTSLRTTASEPSTSTGLFRDGKMYSPYSASRSSWCDFCTS